MDKFEDFQTNLEISLLDKISDEGFNHKPYTINRLNFPNYV
jgi:hypothetical protein